MTEHDDSGYTLVVQLFSDSPAFRDGFEAGVAYERMRAGEREPYAQMIHADGIGQLQHIASRMGWLVEFDRLDDTWATMRATPRVTTPEADHAD